MTAGAFNLRGNVDTPPRLENGAMDYEKHSHTQYSADNQQLCHATALSAFRRSRGGILFRNLSRTTELI